MENTVFNGTATKDHEDWKKKKGYGSIIVAVSLALLFSLSAGGYLGSGTNLPPSLHRDEKGMTNAVSSSSSTSLVGSSTAEGGSSSHCKKNTGYNCGAVFPPDGNMCGQKGCCCKLEDGTGYKVNTCDSAKGYAYRGCDSCWGKDACFRTTNINVGTSSCHGNSSCRFVSDSTIDNFSCHGDSACNTVQDSTIGGGSCLADYACTAVSTSTIHDGSCNYTYSCRDVKNSIIGKGSCTGDGKSCAGSENVKIGNNSCNGVSVCYKCKHNVPDNACNQGITADMTKDGYCRYCGKKP